MRVYMKNLLGPEATSKQHQYGYGHGLQQSARCTAHHEFLPARMAIRAHDDEVRIQVRSARNQHVAHGDVVDTVECRDLGLDIVPRQQERDVGAWNAIDGTSTRLAIRFVESDDGDLFRALQERHRVLNSGGRLTAAVTQP